ncbi:hypothetical protein CTAYLR_009594 [Chrysophaeum taylorii]|uniref:ABC transporter domain-containing protein n=1 Tax=Chrysophaeum taylorii TaxID=2483200 RepID=A0AAD7UKP8_9STRA|nr:hypothetical protein CTAYLR_009594 [Chrysophaeum taylorii]
MPKENVKSAAVNTNAKRVSSSSSSSGSSSKASAKKAAAAAEPPKPSKDVLAKIAELKEGPLAGLEAAFRKEGALDEAGLWLASLATDAGGRAAEPFAVEAIPQILKALGSKKGGVRVAAKATWASTQLSPASAPLELKKLFAAVAPEESWQTRAAALRRISALCSSAPAQVAAKLPEVVPAVASCLWDTKKDVSEAAQDAMREALELCGNRDIEAMLPALTSAAIRPKEVPECVHSLAATTFVQSVDAPTLAIVVPLLTRALSDRSAGATALKRQAALIICNMSKLVDDPRDAAPFLPTLLPGLAKLADELADPEARAVCERSVELMRRLEQRCAGAADATELESVVKNALAGIIEHPTVLAHASGVGAALAARHCFDPDAWSDALCELLEPWAVVTDVAAAVDAARRGAKEKAALPEDEVEEADDAAEELCNCQFTLAYGSKILLHNTQLKLKRGYKYGLLGANDSGKTSLLRSLANNQLENFPGPDQVRTVFVEADILGELSHLACLDYIFNDARIQACGVPRDDVAAMMLRVGFSEKMLTDPVTTLSGGWRMKLALSRAMLQRADILLLDEPTNHLDVMNVKWVKDYLKGLKSVTAIMVSHDSGLLNDVCDHILEISDLKLSLFRGNLAAFVEVRPEAKAYFELKANKFTFSFPKPSPIEGVKSKGKALIKVENISYQYPKNDKNTIESATVQVSLSSRVACVGPNGAGKSTLIKCLTGEVEPTTGKVWQHPNARIGYIAQHAFEKVGDHLSKTANEYIRWRYAGGDDKEAIMKETMKLTDEEIKAQKQQLEWTSTNPETGEIKKSKRVISRLTGERKTNKSTKEHDYEVQFKAPYDEDKAYIGLKKLVKLGWAKACKKVDVRVAQAASGMFRPLTSANVELHLKNVGLDAEFATHSRIGALSGGQKVKVVLGAATWMQPHLLILDEPTNYLDRDSLGALAGAIREFEGGIVVISHNNDFTSALCNETWVVEKDDDGISRPNVNGDPEWMTNALATKVDDQVAITEVTDAFGNVTEVKQKKQLSKKEIKVMMKRVKDKIKNGADLDEDEEEFAEEHNLWAA